MRHKLTRDTRRASSSRWPPIFLRSLAVGLGGLAIASGPALAKTVVVPRDFSAIQAAVDAAGGGDTVSVGRGTYTEQVVIGKDLNLTGVGFGATIIKAPATLTPYAVEVPTGRSVAAVVRVGHGAHVRMSGLTVRGPIPCGVEVTGIQALQAATLELSDARVTGLQADAATCGPADAAGRAIVYGTPPHVVVDGEHGTTAFGHISHVTVDRYQHAAVSITGPSDGPPSRVTIANNVITGGWEIPSDQFGIEIDDGALARVSQNTIDNNVCGGDGCGADPINEVQGMGILVLAARAGTRIADNHLAGNDVGVYQLFSPDCCAVSDNNLRDNRYFGIVIQDGDGNTSGNTITGGQTGIGVVADALDTTGVLRGDHISGTSVAPVREIECCGFNATAIVKR